MQSSIYTEGGWLYVRRFFLVDNISGRRGRTRQKCVDVSKINIFLIAVTPSAFGALTLWLGDRKGIHNCVPGSPWQHGCSGSVLSASQEHCYCHRRDAPLKPEGKAAHTTITVFLTNLGSMQNTLAAGAKHCRQFSAVTRLSSLAEKRRCSF